MSRKVNIINNVITYAVTLVMFILVTAVGERYGNNFWELFFLLLAGALLAGLIITFVHEIGHVIGGKANGFAFVSMTVFFFKWTKVKKKIKFSFVPLGNQAGYTEMVPVTADNIEKRFVKMTLAPVFWTIIPTVLGVVPFFLTILPSWAYCLWVMLLPVGVYSILDNLLPMSVDGVKNDGAVALGFKKLDDTSKVMINLLKIQAEMYQGKTPAQIDENLYFDVPQLREDDYNYFYLLNARYNYYLDKEDFEKAKDVTERLLAIDENLPKEMMDVAKADALYNACTFNFDESLADDLTYELEKYLNFYNNATNIRIKLAYILFVKGEKEAFELFYKQGLKEINRCQIKGLANFEKKLFDKIKVEYEKSLV